MGRQDGEAYYSAEQNKTLDSKYLFCETYQNEPKQLHNVLIA